MPLAAPRPLHTHRAFALRNDEGSTWAGLPGVETGEGFTTGTSRSPALSGIPAERGVQGTQLPLGIGLKALVRGAKSEPRKRPVPCLLWRETVWPWALWIPNLFPPRKQHTPFIGWRGQIIWGTGRWVSFFTVYYEHFSFFQIYILLGYNL